MSVCVVVFCLFIKWKEEIQTNLPVEDLVWTSLWNWIDQIYARTIFPSSRLTHSANIREIQVQSSQTVACFSSAFHFVLTQSQLPPQTILEFVNVIPSEIDIIVHVQTMSTCKISGELSFGAFVLILSTSVSSATCQRGGQSLQGLSFICFFSVLLVFFFSSSQQQYSQINPLKLLFLHATCIEFYVVSERECSKFCCFVYTFTLQVWVSAWKKKNCLQICDRCGLFIHSSSTEILSQNSLFYTYSLFYTFIHKHLKILKCSHRTASRKLFCSKRRVAESESSSLHHRYGWNNSSHWVPLQQDITVLLGGWNKSDENTRFTKPPSCHSKVKPVREHWFQVTSLQIFTSHFINACH